MKQSLLVLMLLSGVAAFSQDTLFWRNGNKELVKLKEITAHEVSYYQYDHLDGPAYVADKAGIEAVSVHAATGNNFTKLIFVHESSKADTAALITVTTLSDSRIKERLYTEGKRIYKGDQIIGDQSMRALIAAYPYQEVKADLSYLNRKMIANRRLSRTFIFTAIPVAAITLEGVFVYSLSGSLNAGLPFFGGGLLLTSGLVYLNFHFKSRARQQRKELVDTYNNPY